jgi:hypothetical protein
LKPRDIEDSSISKIVLCVSPEMYTDIEVLHIDIEDFSISTLSFILFCPARAGLQTTITSCICYWTVDTDCSVEMSFYLSFSLKISNSALSSWDDITRHCCRQRLRCSLWCSRCIKQNQAPTLVSYRTGCHHSLAEQHSLGNKNPGYMQTLNGMGNSNHGIGTIKYPG